MALHHRGWTGLVLMLVMIVPGYAAGLDDGDAAEAVKYLNVLLRSYPDSTNAAAMSELLESQLKAGHYELASREELAKALTRDLRSVHHDFHLGVRFAENAPTDDAAHNLDDPAVIERLRSENFGFEQVRIFEGNIGYLRITALNDATVAGETAIAALTLLQHVDALIIDIRGNLGGEPNMVRLLHSAFFDSPTHMNTIVYTDGRKPNREEQWTDPALPRIDPLHDIPLYILTNRLVASAAEDFAYSLQARQRAVVVGGTTLGAAHPGTSHYREDLQLSFGMPHGYVVNPVTGTDWEGTGIEPDVVADDDDVLETAVSLARKSLPRLSK